ncbi:Hypothetical predicted protein [Paramuricea clavata]|uniref:Uncharacterized protein n=1 Tax=Paramuricea clavata TaxID=317549 RepID=A0A7D9LTJ1_PARCT|nr:Hypothetical predicted protein [Paramuricea clavata]
MVSATVNPALMNTVAPPASENFWSDVFNVIIKSCGVQCQPSTYGVMLTGRLSQVVSAGEILKLKWRSHCQDLQLRNVDYYNVFNQAGTIFSQHGMAMNQAGTTMNQAGTAMYQAGTTMNQAGTTMNQAGTAMNQAGTAMYQAGTTMNQAGTAMNQDGTAMNQAGTAMYQAGTTMNQDGTAMNQAGTAMNQAGTTFNQYGTTFKPRDTNFNHSNMYIYRGSTHINQSDMHFTERGRNMNQTGARFNQRGTTFRQDDWPVSRSDTNLNQYTPTFIPSPGITHFNQSGSNFNLHGTTNSIERQGFMSSEHAFDPRSESQFYQQNMNCSSDPRNQQTKRNDSEQWPNEDKWEDNKTRDPGNARYNQHRQSDGNARQDQPSDSKQLSITDDTANSQPFGNPPNTKYTAQSHCGDETDPTRNSQLSPPGFMDESPNSSSMEGDASGSKTDSFSTKPATSLYSTGNPRPLDNAHNRTSTKTTTGTENTTLNVDGTSPPCNTKVIAMPERSLNYTTCYQPAENHQQSTTPNFSIKPESLTTPSNQFVSLSNDKTDPRSERPPTLLHNTTNHQQPVNHQESSISNTATGAEELTTSRNLLGLVSNGQPESRSEKPPGLSETNINPSPQVDEQQGTTTDPTTGPQNSTNSSNKVGSPANDQPDGNSEKPPPDSTTNHQPPSNGQKSTAKNPTIGSPNSATSDDNQTETPSTNTSDSLGENPSNPIEKIPSNQPQNNQQQTIPNQILKQTSTHEHPNNNTLPNNSPNLKEAKRTIPVPPPRQNRPGPRQNAAKFSTPAAKPQQPRQGSPSPTTESNKNCVNDKPTTATEPNKEGDQTATTENSKASITTDEQSEKALDEQLD